MAERVQLAVKKPEVKSGNSAIYRRKSDNSLSLSSTADRILFLQRTAGNQAVQRLIKSGTLQTKLKIGQPGDKYEQEADRVANQVMAMPDSRLQRQSVREEEEEILQAKPLTWSIIPFVQREDDEEEEIQKQPEEEVETAQAKGDGGPSTASYAVESDINSLRGDGEPLPVSTRAFFEPRFGADFSGVRVNTDSKSAETAKSINAKAFTKGRNIVFDEGRYSPENSSGKHLLAHELTHVVQQIGNGKRKAPQNMIRNKISKLNGNISCCIQRDLDIKTVKWEDGVKAAKGPYKNAKAKNQAKTYYKELVIRAAKRVTAPSPLVDKKPTVADIRWTWEKSGESEATMNAKRIDNYPKDYWKWLIFNQTAVKREQAWTVSVVLHELDHAAHAKALFDAWQKAGKKTGWDNFWFSHYEKWTEPAITVGALAGINFTLSGLPSKIEPSAIEFRAYTNQFTNFFHKFSLNMQSLIAKGVILFYPLSKQKVTAKIIDPAMDVAATRTNILNYFNSPPGKNANEKQNLQILMAAELTSALFFRPGKDHTQIKKDFPAIFNLEYTQIERRNARKQYKPQP